MNRLKGGICFGSLRCPLDPQEPPFWSLVPFFGSKNGIFGTFQGSRWSGWVQIFVLTLSDIQDIMSQHFQTLFYMFDCNSELTPYFLVWISGGPGAAPRRFLTKISVQGSRVLLGWMIPTFTWPKKCLQAEKTGGGGFRPPPHSKRSGIPPHQQG